MPFFGATYKSCELHLNIGTAFDLYLNPGGRHARFTFVMNVTFLKPLFYAENTQNVSENNVKKITFQELSKEGINTIGKAIEIMAEAEELFAHKNAVTIRLKEISNV